MFSTHRGRALRPALLAVGLALIVLSSGASAQEASEQSMEELPMPPQVAVSPSKFEIEVGNRATVQALRVFNFSERDVEVEVTLAPWMLDERNEVVIVEPTEQSLDQWIVVNPVRFEIPARSSQTVRFSVRPRVEPEAGEHRAMIYLNQVPDAAAEGRMQINFQVGVAVYAYVGGIERDGELHGVEVASDSDILAAQFDITSSGSAHVRLSGYYAVWPEEQFTGVTQISEMGDPNSDETVLPEPMLLAGSLPTTPVLPGTRRNLILAMEHGLPSGRYVMGFMGNLGEVPFETSQPFFVPPQAAPKTIAGDQQQD